MKKTRPASPDVLLRLLRAAHGVEARMEAALDKVGLSGARQAALTQLVAAGDALTLSDLAERLTCVRSNITQLIDRLESDGLVRRLQDPSDRRVIRAAVTPLGREKQAAGAAELEQIQAEAARALAGVDRTHLERALAALG